MHEPQFEHTIMLNGAPQRSVNLAGHADRYAFKGLGALHFNIRVHWYEFSLTKKKNNRADFFTSTFYFPNKNGRWANWPIIYSLIYCIVMWLEAPPPFSHLTLVVFFDSHLDLIFPLWKMHRRGGVPLCQGSFIVFGVYYVRNKMLSDHWFHMAFLVIVLRN